MCGLTPAIALTCAVGLTSIADAAITLARDGQTEYRIVVAGDAIAPERYAAEELSRFLAESTGAEFPIVGPEEAGEGPLILVGQGERAGDTTALGTDGLMVRTQGQDLILAGGVPRGTLYAVYDFLEDVVGCRWWSPSASLIPHHARLTVPKLNVRELPAMEYREPFFSEQREPEWAVRNRTNGHSQLLEEVHGGKQTYKGFVHTFYDLVPPNEHFETHPEWYSEIEGERSAEHTQLCLTNDEMLAAMIERVNSWLRESPEATIISVSQNDWHGRCECEPCKALEEEEGSPSGPVLRVVNAVAEAIEDEFPHVAVSTLAYQYTRKPPLHVKPRENVIVRLCSIECSFSQPLDSEANQTFADDIRGWAEICDRLYVWDYVTNFSHYLCPHPNLRVQGPNIRFFAANGVKGLFAQGLHGHNSQGHDFADLKAWVIAKLMWDPSLDDQALIDEFLVGYYGNAATAMREYIEMMHDACEESGDYLACFSPNTAALLNMETLAEADRIFDSAEAAVEDDADALDRVRMARRTIDYVWVSRYHEMQQRAKWTGADWLGPKDYDRATRRLVSFLNEHDVGLVNFHTTVDEWAQALASVRRRESGPPPGCEDLPPTEYLDMQDHGFAIGSRPEWAKIVEDDEASDGAAVMMPGDHRQWATQQWLRVPPGTKAADAEWTCYAVIRCETTGAEGQAFSFGLYDTINKKGIGGGSVGVDEIEDADYHVYEMVTSTLAEGMYLWIAPPENPENVKAVWVDRIFLRRAE